MGILDNFFKPKDKKSEKKPDPHHREKSKGLLISKLKDRGFTRLEVKEVLDIISLAEADIQVLKDSIGEAKANENSVKIMAKVMNEIKSRQTEMSEEIKQKIIQIQTRKAAYKKELS
ncbi:MAG: hypothetical protein PHV37_02380 [Candidatus Gastranaerophilales bacterium]|nr:hypothetical protein [Candidatus Gastranaerophilales bacterium]